MLHLKKKYRERERERKKRQTLHWLAYIVVNTCVCAHWCGCNIRSIVIIQQMKHKRGEKRE